MDIAELRTKFLASTNILKSYEKKHVNLYLKWMKDSKLRKIRKKRGIAFTNLEQERKKQKKYQKSKTEFIFMIVDPEGKRPVGDVHLILQPSEIEGAPLIGELIVMIANKMHRRKGLAFKAVKLMMKFGREYIGVSKFKACVSAVNRASLRLFQNRLGFRRFEFVLGHWILESNESWELVEKYEGPPEINLTGFTQWAKKNRQDVLKTNPNPRR
jgi:RimJ/RimL family protein N-acetyltransferase